MTSLTTFVLGGAAAMLIAGCASGQAVTMADSFDVDIFGAHVDDLHTPYVAGAQFNITVSGDSSTSQAGWTLSSSDPDVIRVTSPLLSGTASVSVGNPGQATLSVLDSGGTTVTSHAVTVAIPDQVNLYAQGLLLTGATDPTAQVTEASIVQGGEATFLARYFASGAELYGNGALHSTATGGITTSTVSPSFASDRDFLQVTVPSEGMSGSVSLVVHGVTVGEVPVTAVAPSTVTHVSLLEQNSVGAQSGASLILYAHAVDTTSANVFGASFDWLTNGSGGPTSGGTSLPASDGTGGPTDLFFYNFEGTATESVTATYAGFAPTTVVHAQGGTVGSTAAVGCAMGGAPGAGGSSSLAAFAAFALALAAMSYVRRRKLSPL